MYALYKKPVNRINREKYSTGWLRPLPDMRDYTEESKQVAAIIKALKSRKKSKGAVSKTGRTLPSSVDLSPWCPDIEQQGDLGSCTTHAAVGIVEYFQIRAFKEYTDGSRLFVYKATRNIMGVTGDTGAYLRTTMKALAHCGVPPEEYWPYTDKDPDFDIEPSAFIYALADDYQALNYFRHDPPGTNVTPQAVLDKVKSYLADGIPSMFGFDGFPSFDYSDVPGGIPLPGPFEHFCWGHAVVAIGYDDGIKITNLLNGNSTTGALKIRNSWGLNWGDKGYGWLPYQYVLAGLASDFWSLLKMDWIDSGQF
jgi:C1A family cysteine protease